MLTHKKLYTAVCSACLGLPAVSIADDTGLILEEITVTATRRATSVQDVPYNISAYSGNSLSEAGVTEFSKIARSIPGLSLSDVGRGKNGISSGIVIRGLNLQGSQGEDFGQTTDPVVSIYLGETPLFANLELRDMERLEVLRGPQGTLYGSGSLGGTLRYIPNKPDSSAFFGNVKAKLSSTQESDGSNYDLEGVVNVPLTDNLAVRGVFAQLHNDGYIDSDFLEGLDANGQPTGIVSSREDSNEEEVNIARISLLFSPGDSTEIRLTHNYQKDDIDGTSAGSEFLGGYNSAAKILEKFERETNLSSLVVEHEFDFATLTSATSYTKNEAESEQDQSYRYSHSGFWSIYAGVPREIVTGFKTYETETIAQEFRLSSNGDGAIDWLIGAYYNSVDYEGVAVDVIHGIDAFLAVTNDPAARDVAYANIQATEFEDRAVFGELTYHISDAWQITGGLRYFDQSFDASQMVVLPFFSDGNNSNSQDFSDSLFKFNTSYDFTENSKVYFTLSEGFRHGGSNGVPIDTLGTPGNEGGPFGEHPGYLSFEADESTNFEIGLKGSLNDGALRYTVSAYYTDWQSPTLLLITPKGGFPVMFNAEEAETKGLEVELNMQVTESLLLNVGYTYTNAELTKDFFVPNTVAATGAATVALAGRSGDSLPGVPENTVVASAVYTQPLSNGMDLNARIGVSYKDSFDTGLPVPSSLARETFDQIDDSTLLDASIGLSMDEWQASLFIDNLTDEDDATTSDGNAFYQNKQAGLPTPDGLGDQVYRVRPRTIGLSVSYNF